MLKDNDAKEEKKNIKGIDTAREIAIFEYPLLLNAIRQIARSESCKTESGF